MPAFMKKLNKSLTRGVSNGGLESNQYAAKATLAPCGLIQ